MKKWWVPALVGAMYAAHIGIHVVGVSLGPSPKTARSILAQWRKTHAKPEGGLPSASEGDFNVTRVRVRRHWNNVFADHLPFDKAKWVRTSNPAFRHDATLYVEYTVANASYEAELLADFSIFYGGWRALAEVSR